jgi:hypothetical protein
MVSARRCSSAPARSWSPPCCGSDPGDERSADLSRGVNGGTEKRISKRSNEVNAKGMKSQAALRYLSCLRCFVSRIRSLRRLRHRS